MFNSPVEFRTFLGAGGKDDILQGTPMDASVKWLRLLVAVIDLDKAPYSYNPQHVEFADEVAVFRRIAEQAAHSATAIPGTSRLSFSKLKNDAEWLGAVDGTAPTPEKLDRLERISIRVQCLLADYSGCFMF